MSPRWAQYLIHLAMAKHEGDQVLSTRVLPTAESLDGIDAEEPQPSAVKDSVDRSVASCAESIMLLRYSGKSDNQKGMAGPFQAAPPDDECRDFPLDFPPRKEVGPPLQISKA